MTDSVFVVYRQQGEYSDWTMQILACFGERGEAEELLEQLAHDNLPETNRWGYYWDYGIGELPIGIVKTPLFVDEWGEDLVPNYTKENEERQERWRREVEEREEARLGHKTWSTEKRISSLENLIKIAPEGQTKQKPEKMLVDLKEEQDDR